MTIFAGDHVRITANMSLNVAGRIANVFTVNVSSIGGQTQANIQAAMGRYVELIYVPLQAHLDDGQTYIDMEIFNLSMGTPEGSIAWPSLVAGLSTSEGLPEGVAFLMTGKTATKRVFGRKFMGVATELSNIDGVLTTAALTQLALASLAWVEDYTDANGVILIPGVRAVGVLGAFRGFTEVFVRNVFAYQRRRKRGVGE